jgi:hypothetical protein
LRTHAAVLGRFLETRDPGLEAHVADLLGIERTEGPGGGFVGVEGWAVSDEMGLACAGAAGDPQFDAGGAGWFDGREEPECALGLDVMG